MSAGTRRRRLSAVRVLAVVAVVALAGTSVWWFGIRPIDAAAEAAAAKSSYAPYIDVTATPQYTFEDSTGSAAGSAILGFVVSSTDTPCEPSWGTFYSLDAAGESVDLDRRVARLRQLGGEATVSFGGAANSELSIGCTDPAALTAAYGSVVDRYSLSSIDLDIEGSAASDPIVDQRRAQAIATLATQRAAAGAPLSVWLTLPVGATGLTSEGLAVLTAMLAAKVDLAGVNGMTMDYGVPLPPGTTMADQGELALTALEQQIVSEYAGAGTGLTDEEAWRLVGATAMIGQNDIAGEVFGLDDARQLLDFAQLHQLGRLSIWSANRDQSCGPNYPNVQVVSDACSGIQQTPGEFGRILGAVATTTSSTPASASASVSASATVSASAVTGVVDDPAASPYSIWNINQAYQKDAKIVWHRSVYQAKYYTQGDLPDLPVSTADQTPWTLIGPVLPGERPTPTPTLAAGTYPEWTATEVYVAGSRVLHDGIGYQAKWWSQGDVPGAVPRSPTESSPWQSIATP